jgi:GAF domain-containing protein/HAMP domain-containing protein
MKTRTKKPSTSRSLSATLAIAFLALSVVVLSVYGGLQIVSSIATQQEAVAGKLQLLAQEASQPVSSFIQDKFSILETANQLVNPVQMTPTEQQQVLDSVLGRDPAFRQIAVLNAQGQETAGASRLSQQSATNLANHLPGDALAKIKQGNQYIGPVYVDSLTSEPLVVMAIPAVNALGDFQGTLAAEVNLKFMWDLVDQLKVGDTGEAYVVDKQGNLLAFNDTARVLRGENVANLEKVREYITGVSGASFLNLTNGIKGIPVVGASAPLSTSDWAVITEMPWNEAYREVIQNVLTSGVLLVILAVLAAVAGLYLARRLAVPLVNLTDTASQINAGNLELQASVSGPHEVAQLATSFNSMTAQLRSLIGQLEDRVTARTEQLRASADVGRTAASVLEPDELLRSVVNLITERFGFYYAAVFTNDSQDKYAILREATGEAGKLLKAQGHRLEIGGQSMVGYAIARRRLRIALDVGVEAVHFANPLLPNTRSEIALPLIVGDKVLGALDVQSTEEAAFGESNAAVLQSMADQIAIALNNALSYTETQAVARQSRALFAASREVGHVQANLADTIRAMMQAAADALDYDRWCVLTFNVVRTALVTIAAHDWPNSSEALDLQEKVNHPLVYSAVRNETLQISDPQDVRWHELAADHLNNLLSIPIMARGTLIGVVGVSRSIGAALDNGDVEVGQSLATLAAIAIENYYLQENSQRTLRELDEVNRQLTGTGWETYARRRGQRDLIWVSRSDQLQPQQLLEVTEALTLGHVATRLLDDGRDDQSSRRSADTGAQLGVAVPIKLRDVPIGALRLIVPLRAWTTEMANSLESIAGHVAQAAENARLIAESEERLARERVLTEATEKVRQRNDIDSILETAATELARYLNANRVAVRLTAAADHDDENGHTA